MPSNRAVLVDSLDMPERRPGRREQTAWIAPTRCRVELSRWKLPERLVRALLVVLATKQVQGTLLRACVRSCRRRDRIRERAMESLVAPVLLRSPGGDPLEAKAQPEQPHRQLGQPGKPLRGERRSVVTPNRRGKPELAERGIEDVLDGERIGLLDQLAPDTEPRVGVGDREGRAPLPVAGLELALEVDAPD